MTPDPTATPTSDTPDAAGPDDPRFPIRQGEVLADEIPDASLVRLPGIGHEYPPPETWDVVVPAILGMVATT